MVQNNGGYGSGEPVEGIVFVGGSVVALGTESCKYGVDGRVHTGSKLQQTLVVRRSPIGGLNTKSAARKLLPVVAKRRIRSGGCEGPTKLYSGIFQCASRTAGDGDRVPHSSAKQEKHTDGTC